MTKKELKEKLEKYIEKWEEDYYVIGIRFEDKVREKGEVITDCSRANPDREDAREYPEYGTPEYDDLDELDGVCAYDALDKQTWAYNAIGSLTDEDVKKVFCHDHCYLIGGRDYQYGEDPGEIIIPDAKVLEVLF